MKYIRWIFLLVLMLCLVTIALANLSAVTLKLVPDGLVQYVGFQYTVELPLFLVVFGGIAAGLLIGFFWEWMREYKHRAQANEAKREADQLKGEVKRMKARSSEGKDDVLALLEEGRPAR